MSALYALLKQQAPNLRTRKGLIVLGLQNDFISPDGKLPVGDTAFLDNLTELVTAFRESGNGDVIWVRSEYQQDRPVNFLENPGNTVIAGDHLLDSDPAVPSSDDHQVDSLPGESSELDKVRADLLCCHSRLC